jgi:hypothetical protein
VSEKLIAQARETGVAWLTETQLTALLDALEAANAEVEKAHAAMAHWLGEANRWEFIAAERGTRMDEIQARAERAEAEVERLTEALREIEAKPILGAYTGVKVVGADAKFIARAALAAGGRTVGDSE